MPQFFDLDIDNDDADVPERAPDVDLPIGKHDKEDLSGTAGTGKTTLAKALTASRPKGEVVLAATTGIAAVNLGEGTTINAFLRYFDTADLREKYQRGHLQSILKRYRASGVHRLLIDEKSMMNGDQLTYITRAADEVNMKGIGEDEKPEGADEDYPAASTSDSIGITLCGDFGQLPPVPDTDQATGKKQPLIYAFDSPMWEGYAQHRTILEKIWRQDAQDFIQALMAIRKGNAIKALEFFSADRFSTQTSDAFEGTTIFAKNDEVDRYNQLRLDKVDGLYMRAKSIRDGKQRGDWKQIPETLVVREGALVMLLANRRRYADSEDSTGEIVYANGDLATVVGQDASGLWRVQLHRNKRIEIVYPIVREHTIPLEPGRRKEIKNEIKALMAEGKEHLDDDVLEDPDTAYINTFKVVDDVDDGERQARIAAGSAKRKAIDQLREQLKLRINENGQEIVGRITYMPLRLAYGCTVHKTQGLTLDNVQVNIRDYFFKQPGMLFVALSRARTAGGLRIIGDQKGFLERCKIEQRVQKWL